MRTTRRARQTGTAMQTPAPQGMITQQMPTPTRMRAAQKSTIITMMRMMTIPGMTMQQAEAAGTATVLGTPMCILRPPSVRRLP
ncbi:hypothetical protein AA11825_1039 [Acetobacter pomorum DSM 11825]|nr:hypothetical protein AA11825_1039 [Acetobacter pomorum DSM 11825]